MLDWEDIKTIGLVLLVVVIAVSIIVALVLLPIYIGEYWSCNNLSNLYNGEYELKFVFSNGCLIKTNGIWISYHEFQNWANLNIIK